LESEESEEGESESEETTAFSAVKRFDPPKRD